MPAFSQRSHMTFNIQLTPEMSGSGYSWWSQAIGPAVQRFNRLQQKLWQKVEPRPGMKLSLSTLAEAQTTHRKTVSRHKKWRQIHSFCLLTTATPNTGCTMTLFYLMSLSVCFSVCPWKHPHYLTTQARWWQIMVLCQNWSMPKVWTDNGGSQCLIFIKPHSCPLPFCTQSNLYHSVPQTNKHCLCFSLTPLFCVDKDFSSLAQMLSNPAV